MRKGFLGVVLALSLVLLIVPTAGAVQKVKPTVTIGAAEKSGKSTTFTINVTLLIPAGSAAVCSGKVTASYKLSPKKTAKWSGSLKENPLCVAAIKGKLPAAKYGKKAKFGFSFKGSKTIKAFDVSKTLTLKPPGPPITPQPADPATPDPGVTSPPTAPGFHAKGHWATDDPTSGPYATYSFFINSSDRSPGLQNVGNNFKVLCGSAEPYTTVFTLLHFDEEFGYVQDEFHAGAHYAGGLNDLNYTFSGHFTSQYTGVGHFEAAGQVDIGGGSAMSCHVSQDFALYYTGP